MKIIVIVQFVMTRNLNLIDTNPKLDLFSRDTHVKW